MSNPLSPQRKRGRPRGSGDRDGSALRQIAALHTGDEPLSLTASIKRVIADKRLVKRVNDHINIRRLRYKWRLLVQALDLGLKEREPFDLLRHANAPIGKRTWISGQDVERWEDAGRCGWNIERGWFGNHEYVYKLRRDLEGVLPREDDPAEVELYLERFAQIGIRFSVTGGVVGVSPPVIVGRGPPADIESEKVWRGPRRACLFQRHSPTYSSI